MRTSLLLLTFSLPAIFQCADFYVSPQGSDLSPGSKARPFHTLERARDAARSVKHEGPLTIWLMPGTYVRSESFTLGAADSGTVYRGARGGKVRIIGGKAISGFRPWHGSVLQTNLRKQGITDYGRIVRRGFSVPQTAAVLELFFDGRPMTLARWPNRGWAHIGKATLEDAKEQFAYEGDRPARWERAPDAWIHGYWRYDWADSYERVAAIDWQARTMHTDPPYGVYGYKAGQRWQAVNLLEELDEPGEWYLDRTTGVLYFWPPAPVASAEVVVSMLSQPLVTMQDASHVEFRDITFEYTRGDAVAIRGGTHNVIAHCVLANIGNRGVAIEGGTGHGVEDSEIRDTGEGGILLDGGDRKTLTPAGHFAVHNNIHHFSRWSRTYTPGVLLQGVGNRVAGNTIHHAPHTAILLHGNEHVIEYNDIHTVAVETGDVGGFYLGRDWTERGNLVRSNYFHNLGNGDVNAVYFDDCASGTTMTGNVIHRAHCGLLIGGGRDNRVENNKFVECDLGIQFDARGLGWASFWFDGRDNTLFSRLKEMPIEQEPWRSRYPQLLSIATDAPAVPMGNVIVGNQSWSEKWIRYHDGMTAQNLTLRDNTVSTPPMAVDPAWTKGMGLDMATPVIQARLSKEPSAAVLKIENLGRSAVSGVFDLWLDTTGTLTLRSPAAVPFALKPGEKREIPIALTGQGPGTLGAELRGEHLAPEGIRIP